MTQPSKPSAAIPPDDVKRRLTHVQPDDPKLPHLAMVGDTYTVLITGKETAGRYCLIDMSVPPCGGPNPHRHDFEEMFTILEGEIEITFRGQKSLVRKGETVNVPANAPHFFKNESGGPVRLLCLCAPAGQEEFFTAVGQPVATRTTPAPKLDEAEKQAFMVKAEGLASQYRTEFIKP